MERVLSFIDHIGEKTIYLLKKLKSIVKKLFTNLKSAKVASFDNQSKENKNKRIAGISIFLIAGLIILYFGFHAFSGRSESETIEIYLAAYYKGEVDEVFDIIPEEIIEAVEKAYRYGNTGSTQYDFRTKMESDWYDNFQETFEDLNREIGYGWTYTYVIKEGRIHDSEYINEYFSDLGIIDKKNYKDAKDIEVVVSFKQDGEVVDTDSIYLTIVKNKNDWYILI